jgi:pyroglutamyl-peptidase
MRALLTGFEGWAGKINPSGIIAKKLNNKRLDGLEVFGRELPEDFYKLPKLLSKLILEIKPEIRIGTGWDYISKVKVERVALNFMNSTFGDEIVPDNYGQKPVGENIVKRGPLSLPATLPAEAIVENLKKEGIPSFVSYHAGTHCCNTVMYSLAYNTTVATTMNRRNKSKKTPNPIAGFIHIPPVPEMNVEQRGATPMELEKEIKAITIALETCRDYLESSTRKPKRR